MSTSCLMDLHMKDENDSAVTGKARQILYRSPCNVKCGILLWERDGMSKKTSRCHWGHGALQASCRISHNANFMNSDGIYDDL